LSDQSRWSRDIVDTLKEANSLTTWRVLPSPALALLESMLVFLCAGQSVLPESSSSAQNNPLHISLFPAEERAPLEYQLLLSTSLDIFEARLPHKTADQDFGLLQAVDERLAMYGWLTNTGVKFVIVVDMEGKTTTTQDSKTTSAIGLRDADMKPVSALRVVR
jgi:hypothetical protein